MKESIGSHEYLRNPEYLMETNPAEGRFVCTCPSRRKHDYIVRSACERIPTIDGNLGRKTSVV